MYVYTQCVLYDWLFLTKTIFGKNEKSNYDFIKINGINYIWVHIHEFAYITFSAAKAYKMLQKNARIVFSVNLSSIFSCLQMNKFKRDDTQYIKTIDK